MKVNKIQNNGGNRIVEGEGKCIQNQGSNQVLITEYLLSDMISRY